MSLRGESLFEGLNFKELFGRELVVDKEFLSYDGIPLLCVCKDEDEKLYFCNCTEVRSEERWVLYPATKRQIEQIVSKSKTPAEVFQDSRVVYMYTIGLDTGRGTLRELTVDELSDADRLPEGAYV
jgi:hypothetical protein